MSRNPPRDLRSRIKHENSHLGEGASEGSVSQPRAQLSSLGQQVPRAANHPQMQQQTPSSYDLSYTTLEPSSSSSVQPSRPARSVRRPNNPPELSHSRGASSASTLSAVPSGALGLSVNNLHASSQGRSLPRRVDEMEVDDDPYGGISPIDANASDRSAPWSSGNSRNARSGPAPSGLGSLTHAKDPAALTSVISALSAAGKKQQTARIMRGGTTAEEESRRRREERKIDSIRERENRPVESYMRREDDKTFREINAVLRKVKAEWAIVADDNYNSVALALSLLDDSSLGLSRQEFDQMRNLIEKALQGTVDDHYESFANAITLHNNVLSTFSTAQSSVSTARRRLRESREALGAKRADLVQMWQRSQGVKESLRLLDQIDGLKGVPERLEALMSEKRFLAAVNLLMRSLKTIVKPEIEEVGATADLRAYLKSQEQSMLDILVEELHNHLYLKSFFCDARWRGYVPGQTELPVIDWGRSYGGIESTQSGDADSSSDKSLKLTRFLEALSQRPSFDPNLATDQPDGVGLSSSVSYAALGTDTNSSGGGAGNPSSKTMESGLASGPNGQREVSSDFHANPEADSFLYIEMLLEALARLGKVGVALEIVAQRSTFELHQLVDTTIDEIDERSEPVRGTSLTRPESAVLSSSAALARSFSESTRGSVRSSHNSFAGDMRNSSLLRISSGESTARQRDAETMRDLFWTLFGKLDAVLQGFRVVHEVSQKITERSGGAGVVGGFREALRKNRGAGQVPTALIWNSIQAEVRTLLHDHLMDEEQGAASSRNAILSINEVLRKGNFGRDKSKPLFKLSDPLSKAAGPAGNTAPAKEAVLRKHESALTNALRASVPGLVSASDTPQGRADSTAGSQIIVSTLSSRGLSISGADVDSNKSGVGAGHRLLVKPDAFNVSVLFQPALAFVDRVRIVMPGSGDTEGDGDDQGKTFSAFLDEFVQDVFLPQLEEKVQTLFASAVGGQDAFQEDPTMREVTTRPIVKSVANVVVLLDSLYSMLQITPFHRESYSRLIIQAIVQYYQRCNERFRDLVSADMSAGRSSPSMLSASWAQHPELLSIMAECLSSSTTSPRRHQLQDQENRLEIVLASRLTGGRVNLTDLITSRKKLAALGNLQNSLLWFIKHISKLKASDADEVLPLPRPAAARRSFIGGERDELGLLRGDQEESLKLPLGKEMAARYEALPKTCQHLSDLILYTLRTELRARALHYLHLAISEGNYLVEDASVEPDPHVVDLNAELAACDDVFVDNVAQECHRNLFTGLAPLMDTILISAIRQVRVVNRHGVTKMIRNIVALQQNLKNIVNDEGAEEIDFGRSRRFWELLSKEPEDMLASIHSTPKAQKVAFDDYRAALTLMLGLDNTPSTTSNAAASSSSATYANTPAPMSAGGSLPGASHLKPGTVTTLKGEVSRQTLNEYLIELHQVCGGAADEDDDADDTQ